jgi:basic amino acid/polyamine antiporter, APA family
MAGGSGRGPTFHALTTAGSTRTPDAGFVAPGGRGHQNARVTAAKAARSRLARRLTTGDAIVIGLGSMLGAGVFSAIGPAAAAAGGGMLIGLAIAAVVASCNATSSAQLAALYPESGGGYVYGRERLGPVWGYLAGWAFVVGKTASCAAMALTFGAYAAPRWVRPIAVAAVVVLTAINWRGVTKTVSTTRLLVFVVLAALATVVVACVFGGESSIDHIGPLDAGGIRGTLQSAALLFFAFAGYARIATLGEEVVDPARTIPRAIPISLGITLCVYALVMTSALLAVGPDALARSDAPLATAVQQGSLEMLAPAVRVGATVASLGVLLSLLVGVSRTTFAMAADRNLPRWLDAVHATYRVPHRAECTVAAIVVAIVLIADVRSAIGFSSFAVLTYYGITNASALTLGRDQRRWPRPLAALGAIGCAVLAGTLPGRTVLIGALVLAIGLTIYALRHLRRR